MFSLFTVHLKQSCKFILIQQLVLCLSSLSHSHTKHNGKECLERPSIRLWWVDWVAVIILYFSNPFPVCDPPPISFPHDLDTVGFIKCFPANTDHIHEGNIFSCRSLHIGALVGVISSKVVFVFRISFICQQQPYLFNLRFNVQCSLQFL